jgi:tetratricopeptide (TPR) repeat protein
LPGKKVRLTYKVMTLLLAICAILLCPLSTPAQTRSSVDQSEKHFARGVELQQKNDLAGARQAYVEALRLRPGRIDALSNLGSVYAQTGQFDAAIRSYQQVLKSNSKLHVVRLHLAIVYVQLQQWPEAERELSAVLTAQPDNLQARHLLGISQLKQNKLNDGIAELETVYRAQPKNLAAAYTLVSSYVKGGQLGKAQSLVEGTLRHLDTAEAHLITGSYEMAKRRYQRALEEFRRAETLNPSLSGLFSELGHAYAMTGNRVLAMQMFEKQLQESPGDANATAFLAWYYREDGRVDEATNLLRTAQRQQIDDPGVLFQMAQLSQARGESAAAIALLEKVVLQRPDYTPAHVVLSQLYFKQKRLAEARRERAIIDRLNAAEQDRQPVADDLRYTGLGSPIPK